MYILIKAALPVVAYETLCQLGAKTDTCSFSQTFSAIILSVKHPEYLDRHMTKCLYPKVARRYHVKGTSVEQNIRCLIQTIWKKNPARLSAMAGKPMEKKPTVRQFLTIVSGYLTQLQEVNEK